MSPLRHIPRLAHAHAHARPFHSPFVALNTARTLNSPSTPAPVYEKQHDSSPEPHLSSSGTRTYVVSEPDPSNTPYQVPSGAYHTSAPYLTTAHIPEGLHSSASSSQLYPYNVRPLPHKETGVGQSAAVRNPAAPGETGRRAGGIGLMEAAATKPGKF